MDTLFFQSKSGVNPFEDEPLPVGHYHPSLQRPLTDAEKQINLSPKRLPQHDMIGLSSLHGESKLKGKPSPAEKDFLRKANTVLAKELPTHDTPSPGDASSKFDESWPTSERPSTIESPGEYKPPTSSTVTPRSRVVEVPGTSMSTGPSGSSSSTTGTDYLAQWRNRYNRQAGQARKLPAEGSTLAKYIQRFRYSEPKSRQEREQEKQDRDGRDFWWLAQPSQTSTPTDDDTRISARRPAPRAATPAKGRGGQRGLASSSPASPGERIDTDTDDLQTRAEMLLERSESTILSEPAVSSEGIGISSSSSSYQGQPYIPRDTPRPTAHQESFHMPPPMGYQPEYQPAVKKAGLRPEDDILHQWRVRRRLEEARRQTVRQGPFSAATRQTEIEKPQHWGSRLEDFRKRLKQQQLLSQTRPGTFQTMLSEPVVKTTGTDPIPQTIATQTNGTLPSVGEDVPVRDMRTSEDVLETHGKASEKHGGREPVTTSRSHIHNLHDVCRRPMRDTGYRPEPKSIEHKFAHDPIIASPSIPQTATRKHPVPPHLHMACDIIPCPEDHKAVGRLHHYAASQRKDIISDERSGRGPTADVHEHLVKERGIQSQDQQRPTIPHPVPSRVDPSSRDDAHADPERLKEGTTHGHPLAHPPIPQSFSHSATSRATDAADKTHGGGQKQDEIPPQRLDFEEVEEEREEAGHRDQGAVMPAMASDNELSDEDTRDKGRQTPPRRPRESRPIQAPSPVGAAVGQVISDRLFMTTPKESISSPRSSIDSLPSMHSSLKSHQSCPPQGHLDSEVAEVTSPSSSDGEEFPEDELLQLLRRRRAQYENQLQHLDRLIETQMGDA